MEKIIKKKHEYKVVKMRIDNKRKWVTNLCTCEDCESMARIARGNFKRVALKNSNKLWSDERKEIAIKEALVKNQKKLDKQIKNLEKMKIASNRYVSPTGAVWTVIEE